MIGSADIIAFVPTRDPEKVRAFYQETLGLKLVDEDPFALLFDANGVTLRVANVSAVKGYKGRNEPGSTGIWS
ncbi:MAG: VOC family protein [Gemmatimonadota bacterium]|nr:VOC family protein [Gemmatimonadota bacterium]